jgi:hypothetical protein
VLRGSGHEVVHGSVVVTILSAAGRGVRSERSGSEYGVLRQEGRGRQQSFRKYSTHCNLGCEYQIWGIGFILPVGN